MPTIIDAVLLIARLTLAAYVLPSGISKLRHRSEFLNALHNYNVLSPSASAIFGAVLPWIEISIGIVLMLGVAMPLTGLSLIMLLSSFIIAILINMRRGRIIECGCSGLAGTKTIGWGAVARNLMLIGLALILVRFADMHAEYFGSGWRADAALLSSLPDLSLILILVGFGVVFISLVEWLIHLMSRVAFFRGVRFE